MKYSPYAKHDEPASSSPPYVNLGIPIKNYVKKANIDL